MGKRRFRQQIGFVYYNDQFAGTLEEVQNGYKFTYSPDYLRGKSPPIGFTLPFQKEPFFSESLFPFFENLLSEGWLRALQCRTQKIDENDSFQHILENGRDMVGAVTVLKEKVPKIAIESEITLFSKNRSGSACDGKNDAFLPDHP